MKIELVQPPHGSYQKLGTRDNFAFTPAQLTMPYLAALVQDEAEVTITDELVDTFSFKEDVDLVGITCVTPFAHRAYEIADMYRKKGITVVIGGPHASLLPNEAKEHADVVVIGEAEISWPEVVGDFKEGRLASFYSTARNISLNNLPNARRDLLRKDKYIVSNTVQASRGCPFSCDFCSLAGIFGKGQRHRPIDEVIKEIEQLDSDTFIFWDDNIIGNSIYAKELFSKLIPLKKKWMGQATITIARDSELLNLARKSGCVALFIGIESVSQESLRSVNKSFNKVQTLQEDLKKIHDQNILVWAGIIVGFDADDPSVFEKTLEVGIKCALDGVSISLLTPYPGTRLFKRLEIENRLLHCDWKKYNSDEVVFIPKNMSIQQLQEGHDWLNREFYSFSSIVKRLFKSHVRIFLNTKLNLLDRKYTHNKFNKR